MESHRRVSQRGEFDHAIIFERGLKVLLALGHDFVLRRNLRMHSAPQTPSAFVQSTHGYSPCATHSHIARLWNELVEKHTAAPLKQPLPYVRHSVPSSNESFGIVPSEYTSTFAGFAESERPRTLELERPIKLTLWEDEINTNVIADEMGISPSLFPPPPTIGRSSPSTSARTVQS